jgi:predicted  nucleic acid-binding Zn-ribbon protein
MKKENTTTALIAFNIFLVLIGLFMINTRVANSDLESDTLKAKINQIENQLDVLIDDANSSKDKVIVANKEFIQLSNSMATSDRILQKLDNEIKGAVKEIKEVKNMTELQNRKLYISE